MKERAIILAERLTPVQKDVVIIVALPQLYHWPDRWSAPSRRQAAIAWGLIRRDLIRPLAYPYPLRSYEATSLGIIIARLLLVQEMALVQAEVD